MTVMLKMLVLDMMFQLSLLLKVMCVLKLSVLQSVFQLKLSVMFMFVSNVRSQDVGLKLSANII